MKKIIPLATILLIAACGEAPKNETTTLQQEDDQHLKPRDFKPR